MITLYGIKNCDTVKRARERLTDAGIDYRFHDFKTEGLSPELAAKWIKTLGSETLINRKGTTWRKLDTATQAQLDAGDAAAIAANTSAIKRPLIDRDGELRVGFPKTDEDAVVAWARQKKKK